MGRTSGLVNPLALPPESRSDTDSLRPACSLPLAYRLSSRPARGSRVAEAPASGAARLAAALTLTPLSATFPKTFQHLSCPSPPFVVTFSLGLSTTVDFKTLSCRSSD